MTEFTTWRSLVDGAEITGIPDNDIYLQDDWGDNKLQDRDGSGTTTFNGVEGVYRPEYIIDAGSPEAQNEQLQLVDGERIKTEINLNFDEPITWEINSVDVSDSGTDGADSAAFVLFSETDNVAADGRAFERSYCVYVRKANNWQFVEIDEDGNQNFLISENDFSEVHDITVTRESDGTWEFFVDGDSQGSVTDTSHTDDEHYAIAGRQNTDVNISVDEYKVS